MQSSSYTDSKTGELRIAFLYARIAFLESTTSANHYEL